jgi:hypothetical protein
MISSLFMGMRLFLTPIVSSRMAKGGLIAEPSSSAFSWLCSDSWMKNRSALSGHSGANSVFPGLTAIWIRTDGPAASPDLPAVFVNLH